MFHTVAMDDIEYKFRKSKSPSSPFASDFIIDKNPSESFMIRNNPEAVLFWVRTLKSYGPNKY